MWMWPAATAAAALLCAVLASCIFPQNDASRLVEHPVGHGAISPAVMSAKPKAAGKDGKDEHRHLSPVRQQLRNIENAVMVGPLAVGDPPQALNCVFDTGSFDLMVSSTICTSCSGSRYNSSCSRTYRPCDVGDTQSEALVKFGSGTMYAIKGFDRVVLPDSCPPPSSALLARQGQAKCKPMETDHHMPIWQIQDHTIGALEAANITAIAGMPWSRPDDENMLAQMGVHTVSFCIDKSAAPQANTKDKKMHQTHEQHETIVLDQRSLQGNPGGPIEVPSGNLPASATPPGYLTWNDNAQQKCPGLFKTLDVQGKVHWAVNMTGIGLRLSDGTEKAISCHSADSNGNFCGAVIDTGTSLLTGPEEAVSSLLHHLSTFSPESDGIDEGCRSLDKFPNIFIEVGGHKLELPPEHYMGKFPAEVVEYHGFFDLVKNGARRKEVTVCVPAFISLDMDSANMGKVFILGLPIFCQFYAVFNRLDKTIGLHQQDGCDPCAGHSAALHAASTDTQQQQQKHHRKASKSPRAFSRAPKAAGTGKSLHEVPVRISEIAPISPKRRHQERVCGLKLDKKEDFSLAQSATNTTSSGRGPSTLYAHVRGGRVYDFGESRVHIRLPLWAQDGLTGVLL
mmetsp:Transcript_36469/g.91147  ORF Transcript_36469/g.91147 Transcript_36469/m.91147 type:complete len:624 (-) Transcript_36469:159-2030(-)